MEALAPFRSEWTRSADDPQPLPYLSSAGNSTAGAVDMNLEVLIQTQSMRDEGLAPSSVATSNFVDSYWTVAQMVAHHSVNGCNLSSGDFFGSGTQSGETLDQAGALMESSVGGTKPITLNNGEQRTFLEDGDTVIMRGYCERDGCTRIGFGEAVGTVLPAK
jgi:fumarylacetoacetase